MAGGPAVRPRGTGADPREAGAGPRGRQRRPLTRAAAPAAPATTGCRSRRALLALIVILATAACATARIPAGTSAGPPEAHPGARLLYTARIQGADGRPANLRLAAAVAPPDRLRFEALGPTGAPRLVLATDGARAVALAVGERRFDVADATPEALATWTGLPFGPAALVALLTGHAPCPGSSGSDTAAACDPCPGLRFEPVAAAGSGVPGCSGTLSTRPGGRLVATILCEGGDGSGWPERIRVEMPSGHRSIELRRTDGPAAALLDVALFAPAIPAGFRRADLLRPADTGPLLEGDGDDTP